MTNKTYRLNRDGTVSTCASNIARMNVAEVLYYQRRILFSDILQYLEEIKELLEPTLILLFAPVAFPISAYLAIRTAKKEVAREEARNEL